MAKKEKTIYQRIMAAASVGRGMRLTAKDVGELSNHGAIRILALCDDFDEQDPDNTLAGALKRSLRKR
jgi:hypothetical protein